MQGSAGLAGNGGGWERAGERHKPGLQGQAPAQAVKKRPCPQGHHTPLAQRQVNTVYVSDTALPGAAGCRRAGRAAQAEVSKRRSIMSPTCSTRYLMYFSGFLVKGTLPYLPGTEVSGRPPPAPPSLRRSLRPSRGVSLRHSTEGGGWLTCAERPRRSP